MKALTDYIHARGLKAGIYTSPGPTTCGGLAAAYQHEEKDVQQFVDWGFDFLKYDWCSYGNLAKGSSREVLQKPYRQMGALLQKQPRDVILNLCQYGMGQVWEWGKEVGGHSWRTAGDFGLTHEGISTRLYTEVFDLYAQKELHRFGGPGGWNDPDYILVGPLYDWRGKIRPTSLSPNEQYTHVSFWALVAAPFILGGDILHFDAFTLNLLSNDEVIDVDQDPLAKPARRVARDEDGEVWVRDLEDGSKAVGLFNRGETQATVTARWPELGVRGQQLVRDLWRQKDLGVFANQYQAPVPRHGVVLLRFRPQ
jgi:alpha-galactosidase